MRDDDYPTLDDDKILDAIPEHDIEEWKPRATAPQQRSLRTLPASKRPRKRRIGRVILLFLVGIVLGWFLHGYLFPEAREKEPGGTFSALLAYPVEGIRLERASRRKQEGMPPEKILLRPGEKVDFRYGRETLRFLSLERRSSFLSRVKGIVLPSPALYLEDRRLEPGQDVSKLIEPEKSTTPSLTLRSPGDETPMATFELEIEMDAEAWIERSRQLEDPQARRICLEKALESDPQNEKILFALGQLLWKQNDIGGAVRVLEKVLKKNPKHIEAAKTLAVIYWKKQPKKALRLYASLAKIDNANKLDHYKQIARLEERLGLSTVDTYKKILSLRKNDPDAKQGLENLYAQYVRKAQQYEKKGLFPQAIAEMKRALAVRSTRDGRIYLSALYNNLGFDLAKKGKYKEAIPNYEASLKIDQNPSTYLNLADAYAKTKQIPLAIKALEKAQDLKPTDVRLVKGLYLLWGDLLVAQKQYDRAVQVLQSAYKKLPKDPDILRTLGMTYWKKGDLLGAAKSLEALATLIRKHPPKERGEVYRFIGDLYRSLGDREKTLLAQIGRYDQALRAYKQAISLNGSDKAAQKAWEEVAAQRKALKIKSLQSS